MTRETEEVRVVAVQEMKAAAKATMVSAMNETNWHYQETTQLEVTQT